MLCRFRNRWTQSIACICLRNPTVPFHDFSEILNLKSRNNISLKQPPVASDCFCLVFWEVKWDTHKKKQNFYPIIEFLPRAKKKKFSVRCFSSVVISIMIWKSSTARVSLYICQKCANIVHRLHSRGELLLFVSVSLVGDFLLSSFLLYNRQPYNFYFIFFHDVKLTLGDSRPEEEGGEVMDSIFHDVSDIGDSIIFVCAVSLRFALYFSKNSYKSTHPPPTRAVVVRIKLKWKWQKLKLRK